MAVTQTVYEADGKTVLTDGTTYYDELERRILANQRALASGTYNRTELRYDNLGRVLQVALPCTWTDVATTCPNWSTTSYDLINRPLSVSRPISATDSNPQTTTYTYSGDTTVVTDPQGNTQTTVTDPTRMARRLRSSGVSLQTMGQLAILLLRLRILGLPSSSSYGLRRNGRNNDARDRRLCSGPRHLPRHEQFRAGSGTWGDRPGRPKYLQITGNQRAHCYR